jgi:hypothetical protein
MVSIIPLNFEYGIYRAVLLYFVNTPTSYRSCFFFILKIPLLSTAILFWILKYFYFLPQQNFEAVAFENVKNLNSGVKMQSFTHC